MIIGATSPAVGRRRSIYLDATPLNLLARGPTLPVAARCSKWFDDRRRDGWHFVVPEVIDFEVRRELLRRGATNQLRRLDRLPTLPGTSYLAINTKAMRRAAHLWADLRRGGKPTADPHALDGDVILAAQLLVEEKDPSAAVVATGNVGHLGRLVNCDEWPNIA